MTFEVINGDCLEVMAGMDAGSVDVVVTDPPYGLEFMGKEWDRLGAVALTDPAIVGGFQDGNGGNAFPRSRVRFGRSTASMQAWHQQWAESALHVLKPSRYLLAFGGTRTWHRLACAIEDAGFEIRDTLCWLHGQGFPKGKACLKPAWEPVILARKPGPMRELGIDECRIGFVSEEDAAVAAVAAMRASADQNAGRNAYGCFENGPASIRPYLDNLHKGRWPANLILDEEAAGMLDGAVGDRPGYASQRHLTDAADKSIFGISASPERDALFFNDSGGPSRFFYTAKASRAERGEGNHHPTVKPVNLMRWLVRLVAREGDTVLDPFTGSGTTGVACAHESRDFIGIEREAEYVEIARRRIEAAASQMRLPI